MYRKLALTSLSVHLALFFLTLWFLVPGTLELFRVQDLKIEMPTPVLWLITASHFVTSPFGFVLSLMLCVGCYLCIPLLDRKATQAN